MRLSDSTLLNIENYPSPPQKVKTEPILNVIAIPKYAASSVRILQLFGFSLVMREGGD